MATHSSILVWRIPRTEDLVGCSPQGCREPDMTEATEHPHPRHVYQTLKNEQKTGASILQGQYANSQCVYEKVQSTLHH